MYMQLTLTMTDDTMPIYSNTCGKLFANRIVFASALRETAFNPREIKHISLHRHIRTSSIFFIVLPCFIFIMPFFLGNEEHNLKVVLVLAGLGMLLISVYKAEKFYSLKLSLKNGKVITWHVWHGNISDAVKFVAYVKSVLNRA